MCIYFTRIQSERRDNWLVQCPSLWFPFQTGKTMTFSAGTKQKNPYSFCLHRNVFLMARLELGAPAALKGRILAENAFPSRQQAGFVPLPGKERERNCRYWLSISKALPSPAVHTGHPQDLGPAALPLGWAACLLLAAGTSLPSALLLCTCRAVLGNFPFIFPGKVMGKKPGVASLCTLGGIISRGVCMQECLGVF